MANWLDRGDGLPVFWGWPGVKEQAMRDLKDWALRIRTEEQLSKAAQDFAANIRRVAT